MFDELEATVMVLPNTGPFSVLPWTSTGEGWPAETDEFLTMWRERDLFPLSLAHQDLRVLHAVVSFEDFAEGLGEVLGGLCGEPERWVLVAHDNRHPHHTWRVVTNEDGTLYVELVTDEFEKGEAGFADRDAEWLESNGWAAPNPPDRSEWARVEDGSPHGIEEAARHAVEAMRTVFGIGDGDLVGTRMFVVGQ